MTKITATLEALNAYEGFDPANGSYDVIWAAIDGDATNARWTDANSDDFIGTDGLHYGYRPQAFNGPWIIIDD